MLKNEDNLIYNEIKQKLNCFNLKEYEWQDKSGTKHPFLYCNTKIYNVDIYILPLRSYANRIEVGFTVDNKKRVFKKEEIKKIVDFFKGKADKDLIGMNPENGKITSVFIQYPEPFDLKIVLRMFKELNRAEILEKIFSEDSNKSVSCLN